MPQRSYALLTLAVLVESTAAFNVPHAQRLRPAVKSINAPPLMALRGGSSASQVAAQVLGWTVSAAALSVYTPMIAELLSKKEAPERRSSGI